MSDDDLDDETRQQLAGAFSALIEQKTQAAMRARDARLARTLVITPFVCPLCDGKPSGSGGCHLCSGYGLVSEEEAAGWSRAELREVPDPPGVRKNPCPGCAARCGSPEQQRDYELAGVLDRDRPFWCHKGMPVVEGKYRPVAWFGDEPLGAEICRGWWDWRLGRGLPSTPFRDDSTRHQEV